jgi:hypothetical protein
MESLLPLSRDVLTFLSQFLTGASLLRLACVDQSLRKIFTSDAVWRRWEGREATLFAGAKMNIDPTVLFDSSTARGRVLDQARVSLWAIVVKGAFQAAEEDARLGNTTWEADIQTDMFSECEKHGHINLCRVDRAAGTIFVKFDNMTEALSACKSLNNRFFGGRTISVSPVFLF